MGHPDKVILTRNLTGDHRSSQEITGASMEWHRSLTGASRIFDAFELLAAPRGLQMINTTTTTTSTTTTHATATVTTTTITTSVLKLPLLLLLLLLLILLSRLLDY